MQLLIDLGNTRMKWAWRSGGALRDAGVATHRGQASGLVPALRTVDHRPQRILLASVAAPGLTTALRAELEGAFGSPVVLAATGTSACGVRNGYREPTQLGVDRWLAMVAAYAELRRAACVVDAGTAVTVDAVAADGTHLGGYIVPGPALMTSALLRETGRLESASRELPPTPAGPGGFGRDTASCIALGTRCAATALVGSALAALRAATATEPALVLTGGDAEKLRAGLPPGALFRPLLVLEGLAATLGSAAP
jgi:type III pantothenate kinase